MPKEHNKYRDHLIEVKSTVSNSVMTWGEDGNPAQSILNHATAGWECDEADEWMDEVRPKGLEIKGYFETAEADLTALINAEPLKVDEGHEHGDAYIY